MTTDQTSTRPAFCGWRRLAGQGWQKLCEGQTEADAWRQLLDIAAELRAGPGESIVLPVGQRPAEARAAR
jgi:hypothetical protein